MEDDVDNVYTGEVLKILYNQSKNKEQTDFVIRAGNKRIHCHRAVISAKSEYFDSLCKSGQEEVVLDYVGEEHGEVLEAIVRFMYLGRIDIKSYNAESLVRAAHTIKHHELKSYCENYLVANLGLENFMTYQTLAKKLNLSHLSSACIKLTKDKGSEVLKTDWFIGLSLDEVKEYLESDDLNVRSEDDVILALQRWLCCTKASSSMKDGYVDSLLQAIRIEFCDRKLLEVISNDETVLLSLRSKILQHLQHGRYGGHSARPSYSTTGKAHIVPTSTASPPSPSTASTPSPSTVATPSPSTAPTPSPSTAPTPSPSTSKASSVSATSSKLESEQQDQVLIVGGLKANNEIHRNILLLDSDSDSVLTQSPFPADCGYYSACPTDDGLIVSGGYDKSTKRSISTVKIFSLTTRVWGDLPDLSQPNDLHGSVYASSCYYTVGGCYTENGDVKRKYADVEVVNLRTNRRSTFPSLPVAVEAPGVAHVHNNLLVFGGDTEEGWSHDTYSYDIKTGERKTCQQMPLTGNFFRSTAVVNNQVYLVCGQGLLQYNVQGDTWVKLTSPPKPSRLPAMVLHENRLLVLGGFDENYCLPNSRIQTFDLSTKKWSVEKRTMPVALWGNWAFVLKMPKSK